MSGAFAPLARLHGRSRHGRGDRPRHAGHGTPWPVPVTLDVTAGAVPADADRLVLQDQEGSPLAVLSITERLTPPGAIPG